MIINKILINDFRKLYSDSKSQIKLGNELSKEFIVRVLSRMVHLTFLKYMLQKHYRHGKGSVKEWV